jgi:predicted RNA-binding Zn ribbon-like protein
MVSVGQLARQFNVPNELANLYEFANSLDLRCFTHNRVQHATDDELANAHGLASWMAERGLVKRGATISSSQFDAAIELRSGVRALIACDPADRPKNARVWRALNKILQHFPVIAQANHRGEMGLQSVRNDVLGGLSTIVTELYSASKDGSLDRLKMCAAQECRRVFFDRSKPSSRRWCLSTLCGNRMKTRTYRERHKNIVLP